MILCLGVIGLVSAVGLTLIYNMTKGTIAAANLARTTGALANVMPPFDNNPMEGAVEMELDGIATRVFTGRMDGRTTGFAVETSTRLGYSGIIRMLVGFTPEGEVHNIEVLEQSETPGLGDKILHPDNVLVVSFRGRNPVDMQMAVVKDGGEVDAITASTVTSRAYIDAVDRAHRAFVAVSTGAVALPSVMTGATAHTAEAETTAGIDAMAFVAAVLPVHNVVSTHDLMLNSERMVVHTAQQNGVTVGYAVQTESDEGWSGVIRLMVGFLPDGTIYDIAVMEQNETPGYGDVITRPDNALAKSLRGRNAHEVQFGLRGGGGGTAAPTDVSRTRGREGGREREGREGGHRRITLADAVAGDVDGITGSTVTSVAYVDAVERAYKAFAAMKHLE